MSERKTIIRTVGLKKHYTVGGNTVRALDGVDMSVLQGEFVCVAGRSGSGKSTMLNMLAGLEPPTEGEIICLLYTSPSPRDVEESRMPSSA